MAIRVTVVPKVKEKKKYPYIGKHRECYFLFLAPGEGIQLCDAEYPDDGLPLHLKNVDPEKQPLCENWGTPCEENYEPIKCGILIENDFLNEGHHER